MYNTLLRVSIHSSADKIKYQINFALSHARLYLAELDDEQDDKSVIENTFDISCDSGGSSS